MNIQLKYCRLIGLLIAVLAVMSLSSMKSAPAKTYTGNITAAEFKAQLGLIAWLDHFDFDAHCKVVSYTVHYTPRRSDPISIQGKGGTFQGQVKFITRQAKSGDQYAFTDVRVKCPGDVASRKINGLYFKIR